MNNLLFNIRFGHHHLQISKYPFKIRWNVNQYWIIFKPDKWFAVYCWCGKHYN